jgi:hypothetical protein
MFLAMPSQMQITRYIQEQLSNYNYTFPGVQMVSVTHVKVSI